MNIEITGETERLFQAAMAAGQYASAEEFIAFIVERLRSGGALHLGDSMPKHISLADLPNKPHPVTDTEASDYQWSVADEWPARWEDQDILSEAWNDNDEPSAPLAEIHIAMQGISGSLSSDACDERSDRQ